LTAVNLDRSLLAESAAPTRKGGGEAVKKPLYGAFSPYNAFYYCARCEWWIPKEAAKRNARGYPCCPYCGNPLRLHPRNRPRPRKRARWEP
jgi:DNA-directed RNA polymerase subunit RPC12/RpoP